MLKDDYREVGQTNEARRPPPQRSFKLHGQELVEFALVFMVLVLFIFGAVDVARGFYTVIVVSNAAREGARYGVSHGIEVVAIPLNPNQLVLSGTPAGQDIRSAVKQEAAGAQITLTDGDIAIACLPAGTCGHGQPLRVTVTHNFTPVLTWILGQPTLAIRRAAEMMIP